MPLSLKSLTEYSLRRGLHEEVHSRPPTDVEGQILCTHFAVLTGERGAQAERERIGELAEEMGAALTRDFGNHLSHDLGPVRLVWERHTEFSTYTFFKPLEGAMTPEEVFACAPLSDLPDSAAGLFDGEILTAVKIAVMPRPEAEMEPLLPSVFGENKLTGSRLAQGLATAWTDLRLDEDGFGRILIANESLRPGRMGRMLQRLIEIETYRMTALLGFPLAREVTPEIGDMEAALAEIAAETATIRGLDGEQKQLARLTEMAAHAERLSAHTEYRFSASRAYYELVERRLGELSEAKMEGYQQISTFVTRRLRPAMRTVEAVSRRLNTLSEHIGRASELLRTRVDIALQEQNQRLLGSVERGVRLQLRLQEMVEGLSAVAIAYYLLSILAYPLEALHEAPFGKALPGDPLIWKAVMGPLFIVVIYLLVRRMGRVLRGPAED